MLSGDLAEDFARDDFVTTTEGAVSPFAFPYSAARGIALWTIHHARQPSDFSHAYFACHLFHTSIAIMALIIPFDGLR